MQAIIKPGTIHGSITAPPSKSMMQRACAAALLYDGKTIINNPGQSDDDIAALNIIQQLGTEVYYTPENNIEIYSRGVRPVTDTIHCGESGLSARLFIPIAALCDTEITITGSGSLLQRTMTEYLKVLPQLGVSILETNDCLPLSVRGPLRAEEIVVDGSLSSQFLTGLLMVYGFTTTKTVTIHVNNLNSKPYIDLTLQMLQHYGIPVINHYYGAFTLSEPIFSFGTPVTIDVEGDWSAAANFMVAKAIAGDIIINNLNYESLQADRAIMDVVNNTNSPFDFDATDCPDLFPILSVYAGYCKGVSRIKGLHRLVHKESNRIESIKSMLENFGVSFSIEEDTLVITGGQPFRSCTIDSFNDHRIVMAASIAALKADGPVTINGAEAVSKSYPDFFRALSSMGVDCHLVN